MAKIPVPARVQSGSRELNAAQDNIISAIRQIVDHEQLTGQTIQSVTVTATARGIAHGLGRTPIGWRLADKTGAGDVYRTAWDSRTITLRTASGSVTVNIEVW